MNKLAILLAFFASLLSVSAQTLTGTITDNNNSGIINAHITTNAGAHTHSSKDGKFAIENVKLNDTLLITHISYMSQSFIISSFNPITIALSEISFELAAVEVKHSVKAINSITEIDVAVTIKLQCSAAWPQFIVAYVDSTASGSGL